MADGLERRRYERRPATGGAGCAIASSSGERLATLRDVSLAGVGVILPERVEVGGELHVRLTNAGQGFDKLVVVRVAHVTPVPGGFAVGGVFADLLTFDELAELVV